MNQLRRSAFVALAACVLLAACSATAAAPSPTPSSTPSTSPSAPPGAAQPSPTPSPRSTPSPKATPVPTGTAVPIEPSVAPDDSLLEYARVVANDLRVRAEPGDQSPVREPSLPHGMLVVVVDGPVQASGYDWHQVQPTILQESARFYPFGWVAGADKDGEAWLEPATVECPPLPSSLREVASLNHVDEMIYELTCFGDEEVTFRARLATSSAICGLELPYGARAALDDGRVLHRSPLPRPRRSREHGRAVHELGTRRRRAESRFLDAARRAAGRRSHRPVRPSRGTGLPRGRPVRDAKRGPPRSRFDRHQLPATVCDHRRSRSRGMTTPS